MNRVAKYLVNIISQTNPEFTQLQLLKMEYGLVCIFSEVSKFIPLLVIFKMLSLHTYFIIAFLFFGANRLFSGGYHAKTYWKCFIFTYALFIFLVYAGYYFKITMFLSSILLITGVIAVCIYAPVDNENKPIISNKRRLQMKYYAIIAIILTSIACYFLPNKYFETGVISIITSVVLMLIGKVSCRIKWNSFSKK